MNPQEAFLDMLIAAMRDAASTGHLSQLQTQLDPTMTGKGPTRRVRVIVIPEALDHTWPTEAPLGSRPAGAN